MTTLMGGGVNCVLIPRKKNLDNRTEENYKINK